MAFLRYHSDLDLFVLIIDRALIFIVLVLCIPSYVLEYLVCAESIWFVQFF